MPICNFPLTPENMQLLAASMRYQAAHLDETLQPIIYAVSTIMLVLGILSVLLRFLARRISTRIYYLDDWLVVVALAICIANQGMQYRTVTLGAGRHTILTTDYSLSTVLLNLQGLVEMFIIGFIKTSIICLYYRLFPIRKFRIYLWILGSCIIAWTLTSFIVQIFRCRPIAGAWNMDTNAQCLPDWIFWNVINSLNALTDFVLLLSPLPCLWRLNVSLNQKLQLSAMFVVGIFVCIASVLRIVLVAMWIPVDPMYNGTSLQVITLVDFWTGLICASLPTYRPLFSRLRHGKAFHPLLLAHKTRQLEPYLVPTRDNPVDLEAALASPLKMAGQSSPADPHTLEVGRRMRALGIRTRNPNMRSDKRPTASQISVPLSPGSIAWELALFRRDAGSESNPVSPRRRLPDLFTSRSREPRTGADPFCPVGQHILASQISPTFPSPTLNSPAAVNGSQLPLQRPSHAETPQFPPRKSSLPREESDSNEIESPAPAHIRSVRAPRPRDIIVTTEMRQLSGSRKRSR